MDYAYIGAIIGMFLCQIGGALQLIRSWIDSCCVSPVMLSGLFKVLNNRPVDLIIEGLRQPLSALIIDLGAPLQRMNPSTELNTQP